MVGNIKRNANVAVVRPIGVRQTVIRSNGVVLGKARNANSILDLARVRAVVGDSRLAGSIASSTEGKIQTTIPVGGMERIGIESVGTRHGYG